jgi:hypothetical protein
MSYNKFPDKNKKRIKMKITKKAEKVYALQVRSLVIGKNIGNKADISFHSINWIIRIVYTIIVLFFVFGLIRGMLVTKLDTQEAEMEIFLQRLLYSPNGISYYDQELKRFYPGVIDVSTFEQKKFEEEVEPSIFYGDDNRLVGAKLTLYYRDASSANGRKKIVDKEVRYNKHFFDEKEILYLSGKGFTQGKGGITGKELIVPVTLRENNVDTPGMLGILVLMQNV